MRIGMWMRARAAAIALSAIMLAGAGMGLLLDSASVMAAPNLQGGAPGDSSCTMIVSKRAMPSSILLGETVGVTLSVTPLCSGEQYPLHVVLVLDASSSMEGDPEREMKKAAKELIRNLNMKDNPATQIGVVVFSNSADINCQLTNQSGRATECINSIRSGGGTSIDAGIKRGMQVLTAGRSGFASPDEIREVMIVLTNGENNSGCGPVEAEANRVKGQGVLLITVCLGPDCDTECMRRVATSARYFFETLSATDLTLVFEDIRKSFINVILRQLTVIDCIPANMQFIVGSDKPPAKDTGVDYGKLTWQTSFVPKTGVTYTFQLRPLEVGCHPTNDGASGEFRDNKNRTGSFIFVDPVVCALNPVPLETPGGPTATETVVTPDPSGTPAATATSTSEPRSSFLYFPTALNLTGD